MATTRRVRFAFKFDDVLLANDKMARYVVRLSTGLNDLRTAGRYATRGRQTMAERTYFIRLMASHAHEIAIVLEPTNTKVVPDVEEFLRALPRGTKPSRTLIRRAHTHAVNALDRPMAKGRPPIMVNGSLITPRLRDDLKRLRNGFLHYADHTYSDQALSAAMVRLSNGRTGRTVYANPLRSRAEYADEIGIVLMHPFDDAFVRQMHRCIIALLRPISTYIGLVEDAWLESRPPGVVGFTLPGRNAELLNPPTT
jgi:hypothetical protein